MQTDPTPPANLSPAQLADRLQSAIDGREAVSFSYMGGMQTDTGAHRNYQCRQIPQVWYTIETPRVRGQWGTGTRSYFTPDLDPMFPTVPQLIDALRAAGHRHRPAGAR
jgi:hypothetical protein